MNLNAFMERGASNIVETAARYYTRSARGARYLAHAALAAKRAAKTRVRFEREGVHVPPFLIASIASECNLACEGCYAHAHGAIGAAAKEAELSDEAWRRIFDEAAGIGVSFILLAGGEPTLRRHVIEEAAACKDIIFAIFTNGTTFDDDLLALLDDNRNLVPVFSIEGTDAQTDARRGIGVADHVRAAQALCTERGILWGASVTVTTKNLDEVTEVEFVRDLHERGCGLYICNEFVPVAKGSGRLALFMAEHNRLLERMDAINADPAFNALSAIVFPGNEERMGGCLAAGRGFFHISQAGAAEPCPFSPFSVANVADVGLLGALQSPFFERIQKIEARHANEHMGGCTLFLHKHEVEQAVALEGV